jgi:transcriptional regulator with GAF, ATPase, and Fis domain
MEQSGHNKSKAAREEGLSRRQLRRYLQKFGIGGEDSGPDDDESGEED